MALNVPDVGENKIAAMIVNKGAPEDLVLKLFSNNITPADSDTAASYTECNFPGYAAITLPGASWSTPSGGTTTFAERTFTRNVTGTPQNVYGYYVVQLTSGVLMWSERDASGPFAMTNNGDTVRVTPTMTAS
jgi:hypothetical protein